MSASSGAQSEERVFRAEIPEHLPIRVRIAKAQEQGFKKLNNDKWLRDFMLEVTNTGDKPIYYLYLLVRLPETKTYAGTTLLYPLYLAEVSCLKLKSKLGLMTFLSSPVKPTSSRFTVDRWRLGKSQSGRKTDRNQN